MRNNQVRLNCGITMPVIGLGTYSSQNDRETTELAVHMALKVQTVHTNNRLLHKNKTKKTSSLLIYLFFLILVFFNGYFTTIKSKDTTISVIHALFHN